MSQPEYLYYSGISMRGTFRLGDRLAVVVVPMADLRRGDVVVFRRPTGEGHDSDQVVHRVMSVVPGGLILRGDFNPAADLAVVLEDALIGRVMYAERGGRRRAVWNGRPGLWRARLLHRWFPVRRTVYRRARAFVFSLGRSTYHWLRRSQLVPRMWHPRLEKVLMQTDNGPLIKVVAGRRTVAWWWPEQRRLIYRRPYDLVLWVDDTFASSRFGRAAARSNGPTDDQGTRTHV